jgi:hypothetical protein
MRILLLLSRLTSTCSVRPRYLGGFGLVLLVWLVACSRPPTPAPLPHLTALTPIEQALQSYRSRGELRITTTLPDNTTTAETIVYETDWKRTTGAEGFDLAARMFTEGSTPEIEVVMVGEEAYMRFRDQDLRLPRRQLGPGDLPALFANPDELLPEAADLQFVEETSMAGQPVLHYRFSRLDFLDRFLSAEESKGVTQALRGDIWVARDGLFPLKLSFTAQVTDKPVTTTDGNTVRARQEIGWVFVLSDLNTEFAIPLPEAQAGAEALVLRLPGFEPGTLLAPPGSTDIRGSGPMATFLTPLPAAEVLAYFEDQFDRLGWSRQPGHPPHWTLADLQVSLVTNTPRNGPTRVMLAVEQIATPTP